MKYFTTAYSTTEGLYHGVVYARDHRHAEMLCQKRNIGENIVGEISKGTIERLPPTNLWNLVRDDKLEKALHEAVFMCFIGLKSGTISVDETMRDDGLIHLLCHLQNDLGVKDRKKIKKRVELLILLLEKRIPGWPPSFVGSEFPVSDEILAEIEKRQK